MAEKPRLKKTDEILGSIVPEPKRASQKGGAAASADSEKERQDRKTKLPEPKISGPYEDTDDEAEYSDQQAVLPSAQSLAEKLLAHDDKRRKLNFEKYELPKREQAPAKPLPEGKAPPLRPAPAVAAPRQKEPEPAPAPTPAPAPPPAPSAGQAPVRANPAIEYAAADRNAPPAQQVAVELAPPASVGVQFEFGEAAAPATEQAAPRHTRPVRPAPRVPAPEPPAAPPSPVISEYTFPSFDDEPPAATGREFNIGQDGDGEARRSPRERVRRQLRMEQEAEAAPVRETEPIREEPPRVEIPREPQQPVRRQETAETGANTAFANAPSANAAYADTPPANAQTANAQPPPPRPAPEAERISDEERGRREFLDRIANQFELQFEERFEQGAVRDRGRARHADTDDTGGRKPPQTYSPPPVREEARPPRAETPQAETPRPRAAVPEPDADEDFFTTIQRRRGRAEVPEPPDDRPLRGMFEESGEAASFIEQFAQETRDEELKREEDFKETLAEKFERERERYLKELEVTRRGDEPPALPDEPENPFAPPAQTQRRKLDFQIQPEMHTQGGAPVTPRAAAASGPVTYTRGGAARPQTPTPDSGPAPGARQPYQTAGDSGGARKKTSEQLLMELGQRPRQAAPARQAPPQKPLKFTFTTPEEQAKIAEASLKKEKPSRDALLPKEKWPRRIVIIAAAAGILAIGLLTWPLVKYIQLSNSLADAAGSSSDAAAFTQETLEVYEDRSFTQTAKVNNVLFKNADVALKNVSVSDYVIVEGIASKGKIRLEDVSVGSAVSIKSSGINALELTGVKAERVIINNPSSDMTVSVNGGTEIGVLEVRTPTTVSQYDISGDAQGVRAMTLTPPDGQTTVSAKLDGLSLNSLSTAAGNSVLVFENGTNAETMSSGGSLSLSGAGRVVNLSVEAGISQGAGETDGKNLNILIKDVSVTNLNVKSPANLNLAAPVDNVRTSSPLNMGGTGTVGTLTLEQRPDSGRMPVDIAGLSIQSVYVDTQSRVNITGSAKVNVLTAGASVYILGNKVNRLIANSDNVIYENKPDQVNVAEGIRPPQSVAENPGIDYGAGTGASASSLPGGDYSTTCGHSVESGGFGAGNGSESSPFEVSTPLHLAHVAAHTDSHFVQTADIDVSSESKLANGFSPICPSTDSPFTGVYDGGGFSISNLKIVSSGEGAGLFGVNNGVIRNVRLVSGEISSTAAARSYVGGIVGVNLDGGSVRSCSNGANVSGNQFTYTGGVAGLNVGRVHDCYNYGQISGVDGVGGIVGINGEGAAITGSYSAGVVEGRNETGAVAGSNNTGATVANCYYLVDTAPFGIGNGSGTAVEKTSDELASAQTAADLAAGNESSLWMPGGASSGYRYPIHRKPGAGE